MTPVAIRDSELFIWEETRGGDVLCQFKRPVGLHRVARIVRENGSRYRVIHICNDKRTLLFKRI